MKFSETDIKGCYSITYDSFYDHRGFFSVSHNKDKFEEHLGSIEWVQENISYSNYGVIRGLHFQFGDHAQSKLVTCVHGHVIDVVVDIRKDSPTYGNVITVNLGLKMNKHLYIPRGCAHGFSVLSKKAVFQYKVDNQYNKESEGGIIYNDPTLNIDWRINEDLQVVSEKDKNLPTFLSL